MNENQMFEDQLRRLRPAKLPEALRSRLDLPPPRTRPIEMRPHLAAPLLSRWLVWRWLAAGTVAVLALLVVIAQSYRGKNTGAPPATAFAPTFKADQVEINRQLLESFDAVANMPDGEPVRFRFQQWMDAVTLRDSVRGVEIVQRTPRLEVVPVGFASY